MLEAARIDVSEYDEIAAIGELANEIGVVAPPVERVTWDRGDGGSYSALRWGTETPSIVLLHGGGLNAHTWDAMLLLHQLPALAIDMPGHGRSSWFDEPLYAPRFVAAALRPMIEELASGRPVIAGHSIGGLASLRLAADGSDIVSDLVIVDASPGAAPERSAAILDFVARDDFASLDDMVAYAARFRHRGGSPSLRRSVRHNAIEVEPGHWQWRHDGRSHSQGDRWEMMFEELGHSWHDVARLDSRLLLVVGSRSPIVKADDIENYRARAASIEAVIVEDAGHNVHSDQPDELGRLLSDFVASAR